MNQIVSKTVASRSVATNRPRIGFLGVGWIGRHRMETIAATNVAEIAALADPDPDALERAQELAPKARPCATLEDMLQAGVDAVVIATPSAQHADETIRALDAGKAVFCQKPVGRSYAETSAVIAAAERANRLLHIDLSYRETEGLQMIRRAIATGRLGRIFSVELTFHNAYGPDKKWYYDARLSGGGCVMDLGVHLVDMGLWCLDFPTVEEVRSQIYSDGHALPPDAPQVEDFAHAEIVLSGGTRIGLACSWHAHAGQSAIIRAQFHGTEASATWQNVDGSFFDFRTTLSQGTEHMVLDEPQPGWFGRAADVWVRRLAEQRDFDPEIWQAARVAAVLDQIYGRA